jgi:hypothetical protein
MATISFSDEDAEKYGIPAACVLYMIRTDHDYATMDCISERLWFISLATIRRTIKTLEDASVLTSTQPWIKEMNQAKLYAVREASNEQK